MGTFKQPVIVLALTVILFCAGLALGMNPHSPEFSLRALRGIFELIIVIVFAGMNLLYQVAWKKNAVEDYFESIPIAQLSPAPPEFARKVELPHFCPCGYDLRANPQRWVQTNTDLASRCPECSREIRCDDVDFAAPDDTRDEGSTELEDSDNLE